MKRIIAAALIAVMLFTLAACSSPEKDIIGTWKCESSLLGISANSEYTFNEDGTGKINLIIDLDFTYAITDDKLSITTKTLGIESTDTYSYSFKGDTLTLINDEETLVLEKIS